MPLQFKKESAGFKADGTKEPIDLVSTMCSARHQPTWVNVPGNVSSAANALPEPAQPLVRAAVNTNPTPTMESEGGSDSNSCDLLVQGGTNEVAHSPTPGTSKEAVSSRLPSEPLQPTVLDARDLEHGAISSGSSSGDDTLEHNLTPMTSTPPSECGSNERPLLFSSSISTPHQMSELFTENIIAKTLRTAQLALGALPFAFPEIVPHEAGHDGSYSLREADFWTCGFFPGTMYSVLERLIRFPHSVQLPPSITLKDLRNHLSTLCRAWSEPIRGMDARKDTHDIGFIIMPALRADWELFGNPQSLDSIINAARSLATRYVPAARAIRSWDLLKKKDIEILDQDDNMIVIIDSMCNLDLMYYAARHAQDPTLSEMATAHALTLLDSHLRPEATGTTSKDAFQGQWWSTCHVANIDPKTGDLKRRLTAQGYEHDSTWSRGQAWGILGYAETYMWTKDLRFLEASCGLAEYFLHRLEMAPACISQGRYVPLWDFDAPIEDEDNPLRDSSAGVIAANGMLILSQALSGVEEMALSIRFRRAAMRIVQDTLSFALAQEKACLVSEQYKHIRAEDAVLGRRYDGLLKFGTANNNVNARKRYANHGLVYGDYYLVEFGNRLLRMGLC